MGCNFVRFCVALGQIGGLMPEMLGIGGFQLCIFGYILLGGNLLQALAFVRKSGRNGLQFRAEHRSRSRFGRLGRGRRPGFAVLGGVTALSAGFARLRYDVEYHRTYDDYDPYDRCKILHNSLA